RSNAIAPTARTRMTEELLGPLAPLLDPEAVTPLVVYLASERCQLTHEIFSVGGGRFARIFIGLTPGWVAPAGSKTSAEDIEAHIEEIRNPEGYTIPDSIADEL